MQARQIVASASYGPEQVKALGQAFDQAWMQISPTISSRREAIEAARLKLADIILGLAKKGDFDPQRLADAAVRLLLAPP